MRVHPVCEPASVYRIAPALVPLGCVVATRGALDLARRAGLDLLALLRRHEAGDWGDVSSEDATLNDQALTTGARVLSVYASRDGQIWVLTEADRSSTTILRPDDY